MTGYPYPSYDNYFFEIYFNGICFLPCRGTANFNVLVLTSDGQWESILHGRLEWFRDDCNVPLETFALNEIRNERLVRFVAKTGHYRGSGLQFIDFVFDPDIAVPGTVALRLFQSFAQSELESREKDFRTYVSSSS